MKYNKPKIIAEIGCNHKGDLDIAFELIKSAKDCGADVAAYTLGANWIERHFTKDRTWKGTDHPASLEPAGLSILTRDLKASYNSLTYKDNDILDIEVPQREKLKWKER